MENYIVGLLLIITLLLGYLVYITPTIGEISLLLDGFEVQITQ